MVYGYVVAEKTTVGHGAEWWNEYYETTEVNLKDAKLFDSEEERDKALSVENAEHYYDDDVFIIPFNHNGKLINEE